MKLSSIGWNATGLAAPLIIALLAIPPLLHALGNERFGMLSLAWGLTAIAGAFDLGIGRAATRQLADDIAHGRLAHLIKTVSSATRLALIAGSAAGVLFVIGTALGMYRWLSFSADLEVEIVGASLILAATIPLQASIATYRGVSEAFERFRGINLIRIGIGIASFLFPLLMAQVTHHLAWLVGSLFFSRMLGWIAYRSLALTHLTQGDQSATTISTTNVEVANLIRSGGWFTISALIGPLLVQADRFFVGSHAGVAAVPTYTVPFEIVTQLFLVVTAVSTVAFPSIARILAKDPLRAWRLFRVWLWRVTAVMAAVAVATAVSLPHFLHVWLGNALPDEAVRVGQILCIGLLTHSIGVMCYAFLHAAGGFRSTALLNLAELPLYLAALPWLIAQFGVLGAAIAWVLRMTIDSAALYALSAGEARSRARSANFPPAPVQNEK